jgi:perosamine synthetase
MVVHLYGHPADMDPILSVAKRHNLWVIEDAAEAHGAEYKGRRVGSIGDVATFSFYGNKVITTGEGGMVTTNDPALAARIRQLKGQGQDPGHRYWFSMIGYNYRMTNVSAAVGLAQLEKIDWHLDRRREIALWYAARLSGISGLQLPVEKPWAKNIYWLYSVVLTEGSAIRREKVRAALEKVGIETRPFFYPMHTLPMYGSFAAKQGYPVAERVSTGGINLPTWAGLTESQVTWISSQLQKALERFPVARATDLSQGFSPADL